MSHTPRFAQIGETFERTLTIDEDSIRAFAATCGDFNPLHHDAAFAQRTRFGGLIASGPHTASLLMAMTATHFTQRCSGVGLDFSLRFRAAVRAGDTLSMRWTVTHVEHKPSLNGEFVTLRGEARKINGDAGTTVLTSTGLLLLTDRL